MILGVTQRTGSTLIQRLVTSAPEAFIWGEHAGVLNEVLSGKEKLFKWSDSMGRGGRREFAQYGTSGFIANLTPDNELIKASFRKLILDLFANDPSGRPVRRWGVKEVRYGNQFCQQFSTLFPQAKYLIVARDLAAIAMSLVTWEYADGIEWKREWTMDALNSWIINSEQLTSNSGSTLIVRYEDIVRWPSRIIDQIESFLDLKPLSIDRTIMQKTVHGPSQPGSESRHLVTYQDLPVEVTEFLARPRVQAVRKALGYFGDSGH